MSIIPIIKEDIKSSPSKEEMAEFREKLIAAVEGGGNKHGKTLALEELKAKLEEIQKNPPTPEAKPTSWVNKKAGYVVHGDVATFIKSKTSYSVDANGTWRRISKRRHEK